MLGAILRGGLAGRNDADGFIGAFDVHHERQPSRGVETDHRVAALAVPAGIGQPEEGIEEHAGRLFESDAVVMPSWCRGLAAALAASHTNVRP